MTVKTMSKAFMIAHNKIGAFELDEEASSKAGYNIWRSVARYNDYICELGDRLEINYANGKSENIWIDDGSAEIAKLKDTIAEKNLEIIKLKAKLYDLLCAE